MLAGLKFKIQLNTFNFLQFIYKWLDWCNEQKTYVKKCVAKLYSTLD